MSPDQAELLQTARDSLDGAEILLDGGHPGFSASRAYYAMFYLAEYYLEGDNLAFSKHSAVISAFGKYFAKSGRVPVKFHGYLITAQELRNKGDYGSRNDVTAEDAKIQIERAKLFIEFVETNPKV